MKANEQTILLQCSSRGLVRKLPANLLSMEDLENSNEYSIQLNVGGEVKDACSVY